VRLTSSTSCPDQGSSITWKDILLGRQLPLTAFLVVIVHDKNQRTFRDKKEFKGILKDIYDKNGHKESQKAKSSRNKRLTSLDNKSMDKKRQEVMS
jgi:hypothetical protein